MGPPGSGGFRGVAPPNQQSDGARGRAGECSAAGRGDRPGGGADRRDHDAGAGHRVRPPGRVRAHGPGLVPGHRLHHGEHGAEHHLRHRDGRCPHRGRGAGAGGPGAGRWRRGRGGGPRASAADLRRAAHLDGAAARPGQRAGRGHRAAAGVSCYSAGLPVVRGPAWSPSARGCWWCSRRRSCSTGWPWCFTASCSHTGGSPRPRWRRCFPVWSSSAPTSGSA